jgi:magnesium transporter
MKELTLAASAANLYKVMEFVDNELKKSGCPRKMRSRIDLITEEIFINIAGYAYGTETGDATIRISAEKDVLLEFSDSGAAYNPLEEPDPDIHKNAEEREPSGLGIFMVKKTADSIEYKYSENKNILTIRMYPDFSVGKIMSPEYICLEKEMTVEAAFEQIRIAGTDNNTVYTGYVTGIDGCLEGVVTVRQLLFARQDALIKDVMNTSVIYASVSDSQSDAAELINRQDLLSLPVIDRDSKLMGIVAARDVTGILQKETTDEIEKMAAVTPSEKPYFKTGIITLSRNRIPWLLVLMLTATITGMIIESFEDALLAAPILATFIPMLMDTAGNAGAQTSALIIRGMALGEIQMKDLIKLIWREAQVGVLCGLALGLVNFVRVFLFNGNALLAIAITTSLIVTVIVAKTVGCTMPIIAKKIGIDPTVMAAPLITTITDVTALIFYFYIAKWILGV